MALTPGFPRTVYARMLSDDESKWLRVVSVSASVRVRVRVRDCLTRKLRATTAAALRQGGPGQ